jgi:hypothetical protein
MSYRLRLIVDGETVQHPLGDVMNDDEAGQSAADLLERVRQASAGEWIELDPTTHYRADKISAVCVEPVPAHSEMPTLNAMPELALDNALES